MLNNKIFFIQFSKLEDNRGITYKIIAQKDALVSNGFEVYQSSVSGDAYHGWTFCVNGENIGHRSPMNTNIFKLLYTYSCFAKFTKKHNIKYVYWRWSCFTIGTFVLLIRLWLQGCKIFMEIPTYPYENEWDYTKHDCIANLPRRCDQIIRHFWRFFIKRIVTFSDDKFIYGVPCINISNGYIPERIQIHKQPDINDSIHMVAVAMVQWWHGFDRIIEGLNEYYKNNPSVKVTLTIVGDGDVKGLKKMVIEYGIEKYVNFTGAISGAALDEQFDKAHVAIGSLGRHRSGLTSMKSLKNVEYASRGIPFVYSENNPDFDGKPFVLKVPADESPLNIADVVRFAKSNMMLPTDIQKYALPYSWVNQMRIVSDYYK